MKRKLFRLLLSCSPEWCVQLFLSKLNVGKEITDVVWRGMCHNHVNKMGTFSEGSCVEGWGEIDVNKS